MFCLLKLLTCCGPDRCSNPDSPIFPRSGPCPPRSQICCPAAPSLFPTPHHCCFSASVLESPFHDLVFSDIRKPPNKGIKKTAIVRGLVEPRGGQAEGGEGHEVTAENKTTTKPSSGHSLYRGYSGSRAQQINYWSGVRE